MRLILPVLILLLIGVFVWWSKSREIRYVALGDSYTFGERVEKKDTWPALLAADLKLNLVANLAGTGKATNEVISEQLPQINKYNPDFVTLLVGANDINRGYSQESFTKNLEIILDKLAGKKVLLLTIPDFAKTPTGKTFGDPIGNSAKIKSFNQIILKEGIKRNIPVVEIKETFLVGRDGLHPTAEEYKNWEQQILKTVSLTGLLP